MIYIKYAIIAIILCLNAKIGFTQSNEIVRVKTLRYVGYIFPGSQDYFVPDGYDLKRWNPTKEDIKLIEQIIRDYVRSNPVKKNLRRLRWYNRQYVGYISTSGERVIWINCICKRRFEKRMKEDIVITSDGGNCYWGVRVNLTKKEVFGLTVNGKA